MMCCQFQDSFYVSKHLLTLISINVQPQEDFSIICLHRGRNTKCHLCKKSIADTENLINDYQTQNEYDRLSLADEDYVYSDGYNSDDSNEDLFVPRFQSSLVVHI